MKIYLLISFFSIFSITYAQQEPYVTAKNCHSQYSSTIEYYMNDTISINELELEKLAFNYLLDSVFGDFFDYDRPVRLLIDTTFTEILPPLLPCALPQTPEGFYGNDRYLKNEHTPEYKMREQRLQRAYLYNIDFKNFSHPAVIVGKDYSLLYAKPKLSRKIEKLKKRNKVIYKRLSAVSVASIWSEKRFFMQFSCIDVGYHNYTIYEPRWFDAGKGQQKHTVQCETFDKAQEFLWITLEFQQGADKKWYIAQTRMDDEAYLDPRSIHIRSYYRHINKEGKDYPLSASTSDALLKSTLTSERPNKKRFFNKK